MMDVLIQHAAWAHSEVMELHQAEAGLGGWLGGTGAAGNHLRRALRLPPREGGRASAL